MFMVTLHGCKRSKIYLSWIVNIISSSVSSVNYSTYLLSWRSAGMYTETNQNVGWGEHHCCLLKLREYLFWGRKPKTDHSFQALHHSQNPYSLFSEFKLEIQSFLWGWRKNFNEKQPKNKNALWLPDVRPKVTKTVRSLPKMLFHRFSKDAVKWDGYKKTSSLVETLHSKNYDLVLKN